MVRIQNIGLGVIFVLLLNSCGENSLQRAWDYSADVMFYQELVLDASALDELNSSATQLSAQQLVPEVLPFIQGLILDSAQQAWIQELLIQFELQYPIEAAEPEGVRDPVWSETQKQEWLQDLKLAFVDESFEMESWLAEHLSTTEEVESLLQPREQARANLILQVWERLSSNQQSMAYANADFLLQQAISTGGTDAVSAPVRIDPLLMQVSLLDSMLLLTSEQAETLEMAANQRTPPPVQRDVQTQFNLVQLLSSGQATAQDIQALKASPLGGGGPLKGSWQTLSLLHEVLTTEQRQILISNIFDGTPLR